MFINEETKYWQEEYHKGNLDGMEMPGEIQCVLDGTAEKQTKNAICMALWALIPTIIMAIFAYLQTNKLMLYIQLQEMFSSYGIALGTGYDPMPFFLIEVIIAIMLFNVIWKICKKVKK